MPQFGDASFDAVLDKGTLDALLCADDDEGNSRQMMQEVSRIVNSGMPFKLCMRQRLELQLGCAVKLRLFARF